MAALGPAVADHLAQRAPMPLPVPTKVNDLMLPPPAPPPQGLPPVENRPPADTAADGPFTIQTVVAAAGLPPVPTSPGGNGNGFTVVQVTTTPSAASPPQPTAPDSSAAQKEGSEKGPGHSDGSGDCRLMGPFAIFVQLGLGGLALMSLVYKRWRERPQRPLKIWFFDASKQVFGSVLVHMANVFMSLLTSGRFSIKVTPGVVSTAAMLLRRDDDNGSVPYTPNPCSFYLLNLAIDTTLGIPILIFLLRLVTALVSYTPLGQPPESIQSGNYGRPPSAWWWLKQSILYFCGLFGMKICVLIIFIVMPWISHVGDWALGWTDGNEQLQIIFVMMLFPLIMNALQYYIIDSFIKDQTTATDSGSGPDRVGLYDHLSDSADDEGSDTDGGDSDDDVYTGSNTDSSNSLEGGRRQTDEVTSRKRADSLLVPSRNVTSRTTKSSKKARVATATVVSDPEYDPAVDGDSPTIIGSSSSQRTSNTPIPKVM
ncbi:vacuolar membrane protein [Sporothrix schenckii 1099-18]|uniref:Vacuolar membrane protein n=1 Tax=Sporothrix schenckii 1099-18 TaxID=1397361 RepID=A0A0F2MIE7_SPOSC|nr:vacuolar membrane protein [Sporothrix schenckii 1099-18]KJR89458.1 vacuolar membrane protein [Sporothrix schenckii 1099-18]